MNKIDKALNLADKGLDKVVTDHDRIEAIQEHNDNVTSEKEAIRKHDEIIQDSKNASFLAKNIKEILAIEIVTATLFSLVFGKYLEVSEINNNHLVAICLIVVGFFFGSMYKEMKLNNEYRKEKFDNRHERKMARINKRK